MRATIKIGNRNVEMAANAATPFIYDEIFKESFFAKIQNAPDADLVQKLGFVMSEQAKTNDLEKLEKNNIKSYYSWLIEFDPMDIINAGDEILGLYSAQAKSTSIPKKEDV